MDTTKNRMGLLINIDPSNKHATVLRADKWQIIDSTLQVHQRAALDSGFVVVAVNLSNKVFNLTLLEQDAIVEFFKRNPRNQYTYRIAKGILEKENSEINHALIQLLDHIDALVY